MIGTIQTHYSAAGNVVTRIKEGLLADGKDLNSLKADDLTHVDEFHIRGRDATIELGAQLDLCPDALVLDIGSGLGGPARTLAETHSCQVTGIDVTQPLCEAASTISDWLDMGDDVEFIHGDATQLPSELVSRFDAVVTIHAAMNIRDRDALYKGARRALKPDGKFAVYDVLQGEGGAVHFPVPWARDPSISYLVTTDEMRQLLVQAGFEIVEEKDSTEESLVWFRQMSARIRNSGQPHLSFQSSLGSNFPAMARNQI